MTQPLASAIAAMIMSSALRGRPLAVPSAISRAQMFVSSRYLVKIDLAGGLAGTGGTEIGPNQVAMDGHERHSEQGETHLESYEFRRPRNRRRLPQFVVAIDFKLV
jgi:hypothetical protein